MSAKRKTYESTRRYQKLRQGLIKTFSRYVDVRGTVRKRSVGALADRPYFGARGTAKVGVQHFSA